MNCDKPENVKCSSKKKKNKKVKKDAKKKLLKAVNKIGTESNKATASANGKGKGSKVSSTFEDDIAAIFKEGNGNENAKISKDNKGGDKATAFANGKGTGSKVSPASDDDIAALFKEEKGNDNAKVSADNKGSNNKTVGIDAKASSSNKESEQKNMKNYPYSYDIDADIDNAVTVNWCNVNGKVNGFFKDPDDCTGYIECDRGHTFFKKCLTEERFNPESLICDFEGNVPCGHANKSESLNLDKQGVITDGTPNTGGMNDDGTPAYAIPSASDFCSGKFDGSYYIPSDCARFYACSRGRSFIKDCPAGLKFNRILSVCDWPNNVKCEEISNLAFTSGKNYLKPEFQDKFQNKTEEEMGDIAEIVP